MINELIEDKQDFVLKFSAEWCAPCKALSSMINGIENKVQIINIDIDIEEGMDLASEYGVRNVPCMLAFQGGELVARQIGTNSKTEIETFLNPNTNHSER